MNDWTKLIIEHALDHEAIILIGNKSDLSGERVIAWDTAKEFADRYNMFYIETCATEVFGVEAAVKIGASIVLHKIKSGEFNDKLVEIEMIKDN